MDVLRTIERLQEEKRSKNIVPDHILLPDLTNAIKEEYENEINELCKTGKIGVIKTLNSKAVHIKSH